MFIFHMIDYFLFFYIIYFHMIIIMLIWDGCIMSKKMFNLAITHGLCTKRDFVWLWYIVDYFDAYVPDECIACKDIFHS